jgi:hypothetical protein
MPGAARRQCMRNFVEDRIPNFIFVVQFDQISR